MKRRHFIHTGLAAIACSSTILTSCQAQASPPLKVGSIPFPGYQPLYLARELGYYSSSTLQLVSYPAIAEVTRAFRNGDLDIVALTLDETLVLAETNPDIRIILFTDVSDGADVMMAKPGIQSVKDLKGKRVGAESNALASYMLLRALQKGGVQLQDIQLVSVGTAEHEGAFKQGLVDAVVTFEPTRSKLLEEGAQIIFDSSQIPGEIVDVLVTRQAVVEQRQDGLNHLLTGWFRALDYHQQNPQEGARLMARRLELTPQDFLASLKLLRIPDLAENQKILSQNDKSFLQGGRRLMELMVQKQLLKQAIQPESLLDNRTIQALRPSSTPHKS